MSFDPPRNPSAATFFHRKSVAATLAQLQDAQGRPRLSRRLGWIDLIMAGIGVIVGGGIFIVTGTAAAQFAGPAIVLSFVLAAAGCALAGLCYAELASTLPVAGSGYTYAYVTLGEVVAWFVGWNILMEYICAASYIAVGWSGYVTSLLNAMGLHLPTSLASSPVTIEGGRLLFVGGGVNLPAIVVSMAAMWVARRGIGLSSKVNAVLVAMKLGILLLFLAAGVRYIRVGNWSPFIPPNSGVFGVFGWSGVLRGAAVVFVAFLGFDALSTLAQETRDPQRNLPIGILGALVICTILYVAVSLVLTGIAPYQTLNVASPLSTALRAVGGALDWLAPLVEVVAMSGLASVMLIVLTAQARICLAMGQDGLLPERFGRVHPSYRTPGVATIIGGVVAATLSSLFPVAALSQLVSLGTLFVFIVVCMGVLILRRTRPDLPRAFRVPLTPWLPIVGLCACVYLLFGVPMQAWILFGVWSVVGAGLYAFFGRANAARLRALTP